MGKHRSGKKRQRGSDPQPLLNLDVGGVSASAAVGGESIESCLADLEEASNPLLSTTHTNNEPTTSPITTSNPEPAVTPVGYKRQERVDAWDAAWSSWLNGGEYQEGLLPCFETELARHFQVKKLSSFLLDSCRDLKMPAFERWLLDVKLEERQTPSKKKKIAEDPVLPTHTLLLTSASSQRLMEEIGETGSVEPDQAQTIVQELIRRTQSALVEIHSQRLRCGHQTPVKSDKVEIERGSYLVSMLYSRKKWKSPFIVKITISHYEKLQQRFLETHHKVIQLHDLVASTASSTKQEKRKRKRVQHSLHLLLMVLTLRYSSFSGGQLLDDFRGGGMQGAINEQGFDVLKEFFPVVFECFASPLNVTLPFFASAFEPMLDWHFGSVGDLALCDSFQDGVCGEANPPFTPAYMEFLSQYISHQLAQADKTDRALSFVVIIPSVGDNDNKDHKKVSSAVKRFAARAHNDMCHSKRCTLHIVLPAKEHGYVEGAQHLRPTRYKRSLYDTSVILLQSQAAQGNNNFDKTLFEEKIRLAFAERHSEEHQKRQKVEE
ncbi:Phosphorylated CTD-interacting factor 1 [Seminavis robusta]|uniref:Phosphorylated CTD-interacting factor 1 n=1 Tax=Seminavis robusta TaxID=568900 RepID=A0A9N8HRQ6_9STRA|nr:Phosphorylated CTD-interacting factor 1 [Seminavis robusta]|eukprot:Sro1606_g285510.1 Phosphorylated CTD-interacting factor 1 (549) ;mRNA; r:13908-15554